MLLEQNSLPSDDAVSWRDCTISINTPLNTPVPDQSLAGCFDATYPGQVLDINKDYKCFIPSTSLPKGMELTENCTFRGTPTTGREDEDIFVNLTDAGVSAGSTALSFGVSSALDDLEPKNVPVGPIAGAVLGVLFVVGVIRECLIPKKEKKERAVGVQKSRVRVSDGQQESESSKKTISSDKADDMAMVVKDLDSMSINYAGSLLDGNINNSQYTPGHN